MTRNVKNSLKLLIFSTAVMLFQFIILIVVYRVTTMFNGRLPHYTTPVLLLFIVIGEGLLLNIKPRFAKDLCIASSITAVVALLIGILELQNESLISGLLLYLFSLPMIGASIVAWIVYYINRKKRENIL